jgi:hypothetical protein
MRVLVACPTPHGLVDEPLGAVEPLPIELGAEIPPEVTLDRSDEVNHERFIPIGVT